ncbi:MAG: hypothetical protein MMC23_001269 [Stictis urceolatum]|nr:hypothetical protein [Stictis urceolata]
MDHPSRASRRERDRHRTFGPQNNENQLGTSSYGDTSSNFENADRYAPSTTGRASIFSTSTFFTALTKSTNNPGNVPLSPEAARTYPTRPILKRPTQSERRISFKPESRPPSMAKQLTDIAQNAGLPRPESRSSNAWAVSQEHAEANPRQEDPRQTRSQLPAKTAMEAKKGVRFKGNER